MIVLINIGCYVSGIKVIQSLLTCGSDYYCNTLYMIKEFN